MVRIGSRKITVNSLASLCTLELSITWPEYIIVQDLTAQNLGNQFAIFTEAFLHDYERGLCRNVRQSLQEAIVEATGRCPKLTHNSGSTIAAHIQPS